MVEKRRSQRLPVNIKLTVSDLYNQNNNGVHNLSSPIELIDISKHGFGFISECILPVNYYINAQLDFEDYILPIFTLVKIIYTLPISKSQYRYGAEFSNLSSENTKLIEEFLQQLK